MGDHIHQEAGDYVIQIGKILKDLNIQMPLSGPLAEAIAEHQHLKQRVGEYNNRLAQLDPKDWSHGIARGIFVALILGVVGFCLVFAFAGVAGDPGTILGLIVWVALPVGGFVYTLNKHNEENGKIVQERNDLQQKKHTAEKKIAELEAQVMQLIQARRGEGK